MRQSWLHYKTARSKCPACGRPVHVGMSLRGRGFWWLHDNPTDWRECVSAQPGADGRASLHIDDGAAHEIIKGHHPSGPNNEKRVRCVEAGKEFSSIKRAADLVGVKPPTLSQALKRGCMAGGHHWEYAE